MEKGGALADFTTDRRVLLLCDGDRTDPKRLVGYLGRGGVMAARVRMSEEEHVRERGRRPT